MKVPGLIFLSGQTPTDKTGKVVEGGIKEHTVCTYFFLEPSKLRRYFIPELTVFLHRLNASRISETSWRPQIHHGRR